METTEKVYIIVREEKILARCYSKDEVRNRLRELLNVTFVKDFDTDEQGQYGMRADIYIDNKFSGHSCKRQGYSKEMSDESVWDDVLKSRWFYNDTRVEVFESCTISD